MAHPQPRPPQYAQLAARLIDGIRGGRYPVGALLPTEEALCDRFGVSRITVRGAMRELASRGLVARRRGIGTLVTATQPAEPFVQTVADLEDISQITAALRFRLLSSRTLAADAALAAELELQRGEALEQVIGLRIDRDGRARCLTTMYIPATGRLPVASFDGRTGPIGQWLADSAGDPVVAVRQIIEAKNLSVREARLLAARPRAAALVTRRWYVGASEALVLAAASVFAHGRFTSQLRRDALAALPTSLHRSSRS